MATYGRLMLLGDSITQYSFDVGGWGAKIADQFQRRLDVLNRGYSGYNTAWIKCALPQILTSTLPLDAVTVLLGTNDSGLREVNPEQHVPLEAFESNLRGICELLLNGGVPREGVLLVSPPPLCEKDLAHHCREQGRELDRQNKVTKEYARRVNAVAGSLGLQLVDFHHKLRELCAVEEDGGSRYFTDGLHLSQEGSKVLAQLLVPALEGVWQGRGPVLPDWKSIDPLHPEASLTPSNNQAPLPNTTKQ